MVFYRNKLDLNFVKLNINENIYQLMNILRICAYKELYLWNIQKFLEKYLRKGLTRPAHESNPKGMNWQ